MYMNKINSTDPLCRLTFVVIVLSNDTLKPLLSLTSCRNFLRSHLEVHRRVEWSQRCSCTSISLPNDPPPSFLYAFSLRLCGVRTLTQLDDLPLCHSEFSSVRQRAWGCQLAQHFNQSKHQNIPRRDSKQLPPCFPHKLRHVYGARDWWIPNKTFKISSDARYRLRSNEANDIHLNAKIRHKPPCILPVNTIPHGGQIESLWGERRRSELRVKHSTLMQLTWLLVSVRGECVFWLDHF